MTPKFLWMYIALIAFVSTPLLGEGRFSQLILDFPNERPFDYKADQAENALILFFQNTLPRELKALDIYDDRLIKRVFTKEINGNDTEVKLVFKDRSIRALITKQKEPFRIIVDLFDKSYQQKVDPITGLPLAGIGELSHSKPIDNTGKLLEPSFENETQAQEIAIQENQFYDENQNSNFGKRKLLQPTPDEIFNIAQLRESISSIPQGRAKHWETYPPYVYPIQTAVYQGRENPSGYLKRIGSETLTDAQTMAEQGLKLFSFGHEQQALVAYQQVLHRDPGVFDKDVLHLWAFAEIHLGHGNLTLASGYFSSIVAKHPDSKLSNFAKLRQLDIKAIRMWESGQTDFLPSLLKELDSIQNRSPEISSHINIRKGYWRKEGLGSTKEYLPLTKNDITSQLSAYLPEVESQRTAFLASSIIAKNMIRDDRSWDTASSDFLGQYFKKYAGSGSEPYYSQLREELKQRLNNLLVQKEKEGKYLDVINIYSSLPSSIQAIKKFPDVSWALAESYRSTGNQEIAVGFYEGLADNNKTSYRKIETLFWAATLTAGIGRSSEGRKANINKNKARKFDTEMFNTWQSLNENEKNKFQNQYKNALERTTSAPYSLKTPSVIILANWEKQLSTSIAGSNASQPPSQPGKNSLGAEAVSLLTNLSQKFSNLGMPNEKKRTLNLLKRLNPSDFSDNDRAKSLWSKELLNLAEQYRKDNNFLEAGRLYTLTAEKDPNSENRAESLYKGGLLLYRAGKKSEAIEAFTAASEDGDNLFYANLAKERLSQLQE